MSGEKLFSEQKGQAVRGVQVPDPMRRAPQQLRSRRMVNAIVESAYKILREQGREGLSTTALEVVSGVTKASIYQYFPNLDAVVAEVFHDVLREKLSKYTTFKGQDDFTCNCLVEEVVDSALALHRDLLTLDANFYRSYSGYYDLWQAFDDVYDVSGGSVQFLQRQLTRCVDYNGSEEQMRMSAYALGRAIELTIYALLRDDPDFLEQEGFRSMLIGIGLATINR